MRVELLIVICATVSVGTLVAIELPPFGKSSTSPGLVVVRDGVQLVGVVQSAVPAVAFQVYTPGPPDTKRPAHSDVALSGPVVSVNGPELITVPAVDDAASDAQVVPFHLDNLMFAKVPTASPLTKVYCDV